MPFDSAGHWVPPAQARRETYGSSYGEFMNICRVRPLTQWPGTRTKERKRAQFSAPWGKSVQLLADELRRVKAKNAVSRAGPA